MKLYYILKTATATENHPIKSFVGCEQLDVFGKGKKLLYAINNDILFGKPFTVDHIKDAIRYRTDEHQFGFISEEDAYSFLHNEDNNFVDTVDLTAPWIYKHSIIEVNV